MISKAHWHYVFQFHPAQINIRPVTSAWAQRIRQINFQIAIPGQTLFESAYVTDLSQSMLRRQLLNISYITINAN